MSADDLRTLFYFGVLAPLQELNDEHGERVPPLRFKDMLLRMGWESRPAEFRHNYQRNKFLENRDRYIYYKKNSDTNIHLVTDKLRHHAIINKAGVDLAFGGDADKALKVLSKLLKKVYSKVEIKDNTRLRDFDSEAQGRYGYSARFHEIR